MGIQLDKGLVVALYCYCRQAERSLDHALSADQEHWCALREYYDAEKREGIASILKELTRLGGDLGNVPARAAIARTPLFPLFAPFRFLIRRIANLWKSSWTFSTDEVNFVLAKLTRFFHLLDGQEPGTHEELVNLRMDLSVCQWILANPTCGLPELRRARHIEHFGQADFIEHISLEKLVVSRRPLVRSAP